MLFIQPVFFRRLTFLFFKSSRFVNEPVYFAATGVSDGPLLRGVRFLGGGGTSHSIVMRSKSGTCRRIETYHRWDKNLYPPVGSAFPRKEEAQTYM